VPRALDYILVRALHAAVRVRVLAAHTAPGAPPDGGVYPSDHFGVVARLELSRVEG
jgi:endonuclease/exonuclease/phosphatase family metal-dependent hydrolase